MAEINLLDRYPTVEALGRRPGTGDHRRGPRGRPAVRPRLLRRRPPLRLRWLFLPPPVLARDRPALPRPLSPWPTTPSVLDVGCAKGFMLHDFKQLMPAMTVAGVDISEYAIENAIETMKPFLRVGNAEEPAVPRPVVRPGDGDQHHPQPAA